MSNTVDLTWAKLPTFKHQHHEVLNDALVAFTGFLPKEIFNRVKPFWEGYIMHNNKKTALYKVDVIEALLKDTFVINLDGTILQNSVENLPGSLIINKIINCCEDSNNEIVSKMSYKQRQIIIYTQIKKDLWALFRPSVVTDSLEDFKSGEWTVVRPSKNDKEYDFNLSLGLLHYEEYKKGKDNQYHTVHRIAHLKDDKDLHKLIKFVIELKKYGKNVEPLTQFEYLSDWAEDFEASTFESKYMINQAKLHKEAQIKKEADKDVVKEV